MKEIVIHVGAVILIKVEHKLTHNLVKRSSVGRKQNFHETFACLVVSCSYSKTADSRDMRKMQSKAI